MLHLSRKIISANLKIRCSKMQPFPGILLTSLMNKSLVLCLPREMHLRRPTPPIVFGHATKPSCFAHFWQGAEPFVPATQNHILTSKSVPRMLCSVHFDFETCFAPQRCALFQHLNFQKWSENGVFCTF